jgi:hypothetical protein
MFSLIQENRTLNTINTEDAAQLELTVNAETDGVDDLFDYYLPIHESLQFDQESVILTDSSSCSSLPLVEQQSSNTTSHQISSSPTCSVYSVSPSSQSSESSSSNTNTFSEDIIQLYRDDPDRPILMQNVKSIKDERLIHFIFDSTKYLEFLNTTVPQYVEHEVVFLIDTSLISNPKDCFCDSMGSWRNCGTRVCIKCIF